MAGGSESNPTTSVIMIAQKLPVSPKCKKDFFKNFCLSLNFGRRCFQMYHCWHILCFYLANVSFTKFSNVLVHQVSKCFWPEIQLQILATIWHTQVAFITTLAIFIVIFLKILHHINLKFQSHTFYWKHACTYLGSHSCHNLHSYSHSCDPIQGHHVPSQLF